MSTTIVILNISISTGSFILLPLPPGMLIYYHLYVRKCYIPGIIQYVT